MRKALILIGFSLALGLAAPASAEPYVLDKSHAQITFSASHLGFSMVHGQFRRFDAQIDFNPEAVEDTRVRFVIDAASVDTNWPRRDDDLRSKNFLNTDVFPEIVFVSKSVSPSGGSSAKITGDLTILGVTREITLDTKLNKIGPSPFDPERQIAGFTATGIIDRRDFGMTYAAPAVGAILPIRIDLEISPAN